MNNHNCKKCDLHKTRKQVVNGIGRPGAKYLIIGEAPGYNEDLQGKPFVEKGSGRILSSLLWSQGISRDDCFITNVCRCRPYNNRKPKPNEVLACLPYLHEEIKKVQPEKIICLGDTAMVALTGKNGLEDWRGCIVPSKPFEIPTLITYHPAFVMRKWEMYSVVSWDIKKLKEFQGLFKEEKEEYHINPSIELAKQFFDIWMRNSVPVAADIETTGGDDEFAEKGLNPFSDKIIGIAFCGAEGEAIQFSHKHMEEAWPHIKHFLENHKFIIWQNNLFDRTFLKVKGVNVQQPCWDTQTGMHIIHSGLPKRLEFLRSLYTNLPPYKHIYHKQKGGISNLREHDLGWYNCRDVDVTKRVMKAQHSLMTQKQKSLMDHMMKSDQVVLHMRTKGVYVDKEVLATHYLKLYPTVDKLAQEFEKEYKCSISSPKQLNELLYEKFKFPRPPRAKTKAATGEQEIEYLFTKHANTEEEKRVLQSILDYRKAAKVCSTYLEGVYKRIQSDGFLYPDWRSVGPDTGRWACKNPNMQNFPKELRDMVIPENEGVFFGADYDRIELWVAALESEDLELLGILERGEDVHQKALEAIEEVYPLTEKLGPTQARLRAKALVFGTLYGRSATSIAAEFGVSVAIAKQWQEAFYGRFKKLKEFFEDKVTGFWEKHGHVETRFGRRKYTRKLPEVYNHMIQSTAADIFQRAGIALLEAGFDLRIAVHDQWVCYYPNTDEQKFKEFCHIMETANKDIYPRFPVDGKIGRNWMEV